MAIDGAQLMEQLAWHWDSHLRPRLNGLSDAEYRWEPSPGAWNVRRREDATTSHAAGAGNVIDFASPEPIPAPVTTIAWRMGHLAVGILGLRAANHFGARTVGYDTIDWPLDAESALALLDEAYERWSKGVDALDAAAWDAPCGPSEGPWADRPMSALVLHVNREIIHHGAEVALLRDLWAHDAGEGR